MDFGVCGGFWSQSPKDTQGQLYIKVSWYTYKLIILQYHVDNVQGITMRTGWVYLWQFSWGALIYYGPQANPWKILLLRMDSHYPSLCSWMLAQSAPLWFTMSYWIIAQNVGSLQPVPSVLCEGLNKQSRELEHQKMACFAWEESKMSWMAWLCFHITWLSLFR